MLSFINIWSCLIFRCQYWTNMMILILKLSNYHHQPCLLSLFDSFDFVIVSLTLGSFSVFTSYLLVFTENLFSTDSMPSYRELTKIRVISAIDQIGHYLPSEDLSNNRTPNHVMLCLYSSYQSYSINLKIFNK